MEKKRHILSCPGRQVGKREREGGREGERIREREKGKGEECKKKKKGKKYLLYWSSFGAVSRAAQK